MAEVTITIPDAMASWIEELVRKGEFASASDYVRNAVRHDRERKEPDYPLSMEDLRDMIAEGEASGVSERTLEEVFEEAMQRVDAKRNRVA